MFVISTEQMSLFKEAALRSFQNKMLDHLRDFSPLLFEAVGEEQMGKAIQFGIDQAGGHGFNLRGPVQFYLELMLLFGSHFDSDPQYSWVGKILNDQDSGSQMQRAEMLYEKAIDYRKKVAGPDDTYTFEALKNIGFMARQPLTVSKNNFTQDMLQVIASLYPQKAAYVGREGLEALIHKAMGGAQRQRFTTVRGAVLVTLLMFAFGHGCGVDPFYPWIAKSLKNDTQPDPDARARRLEKNALTWLEHVLANFDKDA